MDNNLWLGLSFKSWGLTMFFFFSALTLFPYAIQLYRKVKIPTELYFNLAALIVLLFFYFNTEMHERYSFFALLPLFIFGYYSNNWIPFILLSVLYFLNADLILGFILPSYFNNELFQTTIALLFLGLILYLVFIQWTYINKSAKKSFIN
jgi:hypothetical protein